MKKFIPYIIVIALFVPLVFFATKKRKNRQIEETFIAFDTFVHVTIYPANALNKEKLFEDINNEFKRIEKLYGYNEGGLSDRLSHNCKNLHITPETKNVLNNCLLLSETTNGSFDITVGLLERIWGFKSGDPHLPCKDEIDSVLPKIGYQNILLTDSTVSLSNEEILLDLGGIAKGYAVDRVVDILKKNGIDAGIVDAGGDLRAFGTKPDEKPWIIGIRHPEKPGKIITKFSIEKGAVATSGNYERFFIADGKQYHHILNPKNGYPGTECISVTIIAEDALTADALATGIFILGPQDGMELIEKLDDIEGIIISELNGELKIDISRRVMQK